METIEIQKSTEEMLYKIWKKHIGKYAYFTYQWNGVEKENCVVFYIQDVKMLGDKAKIKMIKCDDKSYSRFVCITSLRNKWVIVNKKELNKILILNNL